ncbi:MAG TPA: cupin domain-containing protein [Xanthobacteraceae bacterium]|nr:cupin domain-containing protein [Xanthobacteraceae bacterium]
MAGNRKKFIGAFCVALGVALAFFAAPSLQAPIAQEAPGFAGNKVTHLITADLAGVPNRQVIANIYEVPAGAMVPRHWHHGDEFHLVLSGEWAAEVQDRPIHVMRQGDAQYVEREHWHGGKVVSQTPLRLLGLMIVEKNKPVIEVVK